MDGGCGGSIYYMQSEIFQAFMCYNFDDYGLYSYENLFTIF